MLYLAESPRLATSDSDWLFVVVIEPYELVWRGSLGIVAVRLLPENGIACIRDLMVAPFPEIVVLINSVCTHAFRCQYFHIGTFWEDRGSPLRSCRAITASNHIIVTACCEDLLLTILFGQDPDVAVEVASPALDRLPACCLFLSHFELAREVLILLRILTNLIHGSVHHIARGENFSLLGHNNHEMFATVDIDNLVIRGQGEQVFDFIEFVDHLVYFDFLAAHVLFVLAAEE